MDVRKAGAVLSLVGALMMGSARTAHAQGAVAFSPTIGTVPDGVSLSVRPVVSADRRYVRITDLNVNFTAIDRFDTFTIPAAVSGGGGFGGGGFGGGGFGGGGFGGGGGNGLGGGGGFGLRNMGAGDTGGLNGFPSSQPLATFTVPDPVAVPSKGAGAAASRSKAAKSRAKTAKRRAR